MRKLSLLVFFSCLFLSAFSQNKAISLAGGFNSSNFIFKDSEGKKSKNLEFNRGLNLYLGFVVDLKNSHIFRTEINYLEAGSKSTIGNSFVYWRLNYLGLNFNYLLPIFDKNEFSIYAGPGFGYYQLLKANQQVGQNRYDLIEKNSFVKSLNLSSLVLNASYGVNKNLSLFVDSRISYGLNQIENEANPNYTNQKTNLICLSLSAGLKLKTKSTF